MDVHGHLLVWIRQVFCLFRSTQTEQNSILLDRDTSVFMISQIIGIAEVFGIFFYDIIFAFSRRGSRSFRNCIMMSFMHLGLEVGFIEHSTNFRGLRWAFRHFGIVNPNTFHVESGATSMYWLMIDIHYVFLLLHFFGSCTIYFFTMVYQDDMLCMCLLRRWAFCLS